MHQNADRAQNKKADSKKKQEETSGKKPAIENIGEVIFGTPNFGGNHTDSLQKKEALLNPSQEKQD